MCTWSCLIKTNEKTTKETRLLDIWVWEFYGILMNFVRFVKNLLIFTAVVFI